MKQKTPAAIANACFLAQQNQHKMDYSDGKFPPLFFFFPSNIILNY